MKCMQKVNLCNNFEVSFVCHHVCLLNTPWKVKKETHGQAKEELEGGGRRDFLIWFLLFSHLFLSFPNLLIFWFSVF